MPIRTLRRAGHALAAVLLLAAAACTDHAGLLPDEPGTAPPTPSATRVTCQVDVAAGTVGCGDAAAGGARGNLIVGGQNVYVRLSSAGTAYADGVFQMDVSVQNLLDQPMGTADGTTVAGLRVFFSQLPTASEGTGTVAVLNPDGTDGVFNGSGQTYFHYPEVVEPRGTSAPRTWRFGVPATVTRFVFAVYVDAPLQAEQDAVLRWSRVHGGTPHGQSAYRGMWGSSPSNLWVVGSEGALLHFDGVSWKGVSTGIGGAINAVWGSDARNVFAVGNGGLLLRYDGNRWSSLNGGSGAALATLTGVWGTGPDSIWVAGYRENALSRQKEGVLLRSTDGGASWNAVVSSHSGDRFLNGIWGSGATDLWAVGRQVNAVTNRTEGVLLHSVDRGVTWSVQPSPHTEVRLLEGIWGSGPNDLWVAGWQVSATTGLYEGVLLHSTDGGASWSTTTSAHTSHRQLFAIWGAAANELWAVGEQNDPTVARSEGVILRSVDGGASWSTTAVPYEANRSFRGVWGTGTGDVYALGIEGTLMRWNGAAWSQVLAAPAGAPVVESVTGAGATMWGVGHYKKGTVNAQVSQGLLLRSVDGGASWTQATSTHTNHRSLHGVWTTGAGTVWAVGYQQNPFGPFEGLLLRSADGGVTWSETRSQHTGDRYLRGIWASSASDLWVVGSQTSASTGRTEGVILRSVDGGASWTATASPHTGSRTLHAVWGSGPHDVWAVGEQTVAGSYPEGVLLHSTDGGATWTVTTSTGVVGRMLYAVWGTSASDVWAAGSDGALLHWDGTSWTQAPRVTASTLRGVWGTGPNNVYAVGTRGAILHHDGTAWSQMNSGTLGELRGVWGSGASPVVAAGERAVIVRGTR